MEKHCLEWPAQSPDLNPIEHLWDEMERAVYSMDVPWSNLQQLRDAIESAWTNIPVERLTPCRMPQIIQAVLEAKGGVRPRTRWVYLINWPVSVVCIIHVQAGNLQHVNNSKSHKLFLVLLAEQLTKPKVDELNLRLV